MKQAVIVGLKTMSYECTVFAVLPLHLPLKSHWQGAIITNFVCDRVYVALVSLANNRCIVIFGGLCASD